MRWTAVLVVLAMGVGPAWAGPPRKKPASEREAAALRQAIRDAYVKVDQYAAEVTLSVQTQQGRWTTTRQAQYEVAFDRVSGRLLIDRPDVTVASDGTKLRIASEEYPGKYVEVAAPRPLDYGALVGLVPFIGDPPLPEVVPLLSEDPLAQLVGGPVGAVEYVEPDEEATAGDEGLTFQTSRGRMTLYLDVTSKRVTGAELEVSGPGNAAGTSAEPVAVVRWEVSESALDQPLDAGRFVMDIKDKQLSPSLGAMTQGGPASSAGSGAGVAGATPAGPAAAPPFELTKLDGTAHKSADETAQVIVLDFWATWCPPCRKSLPGLASLHQWARTNQKSVAVYAVNVGETAAQAKAFLTREKLELAVLLDPSSKVSDAFGVQAIPHTVVIHQGKIVHTHVGFEPDMEEKLKAQIEALLTPATPAPTP